MVLLRRSLLCLALAAPLTLTACDGGDEEGTSGSEEQDESETGETEGETEGESDGETSETDGETGETGGETGDTEGDTEGAAACELFDAATPQAVIAAASVGEAATAPIVPGPSTVYQITLPEGAAGFVELQIADWETVQWFYTTADIDYSITTEAMQHVEEARVALASCPDAGLTAQSVFFPHWTPATLEFSAEGPREIDLIVVQE